MSPYWVYFTIILYACAGTLVAVYSSRGLGRGMSDFFLANRSLGGFVSALTYSATTYSAFMMVGLAGLAYQGGIGALGFEFVYLSGLLLAAFFGPRMWVAGKEYGYVSPVEVLGHRYESRAVAVVAAIASMLFLIPYTAVQLMGIGYLMQGLSGGAVPFMVGVTIATVLSIIWSVGGLRSVAWTDALQALIMLVSAIAVLFFVIYGDIGGFGKFFGRLQAEHPLWLQVPGPGYFKFSTFLALTLPWFFFCISNPQVAQRLFVPRDLGTMRRMLTGFLAFGFIYTLISVMWGLSTRLMLPNLPKADMATPALLGSAAVPAVLALITMAGITAAAISTSDSIMLTLSSIFARDVYKNVKPEATEQTQLAVGKWIIPVIAVLALLFARLQLDMIAALSVAASAGLLIMVPSFFGVFFWKRGTATGSLASMLLGGITVIYLQFGGLKPWGGAGLWGLLVTVLVFVVVSLATKPPASAGQYMAGIEAHLKERGAL